MLKPLITGMRRPNILLLFFVCVAVIGSWHGFPLVDIFSDETYLAYSPLFALKNLNIFPENLPYGTFTYLILLPLQAFAMAIAWVIAQMHGLSLEQLLFMYPFIAYVTPRALNVVLFIAMTWIAMRSLRIGQADERPYGRLLLVIMLLNATLMLIAHSGKMWMTSLFLAFIAGMFLPAYPLLSVLAASLAFANFPIMGTCWVASILCACHLRKWRISALWPLALIAIGIPAAIMALNIDGIQAQILDILLNANEADATGTATQFVYEHTMTLMLYLGKLLIVAPFCVLALLALTKATVVHTMRLTYAVMSIVFYMAGLAVMFRPASTDGGGSVRYLSLPIVMFLLLCTCVIIKRSRSRDILLGSLALLSLYTGIVFLINLALPTTYNRAQALIQDRAETESIIVFSSVREIGFPYTPLAAELTKQWLPDSCSTRCMNALEHPESAPTSPTYLLVHDPELRAQIAATLTGTIIDITGDVIDERHVTVENGAGEITLPAMWWPFGFGRQLHITENGTVIDIP